MGSLTNIIGLGFFCILVTDIWNSVTVCLSEERNCSATEYHFSPQACQSSEKLSTVGFLPAGYHSKQSKRIYQRILSHLLNHQACASFY